MGSEVVIFGGCSGGRFCGGGKECGEGGGRGVRGDGVRGVKDMGGGREGEDDARWSDGGRDVEEGRDVGLVDKDTVAKTLQGLVLEPGIVVEGGETGFSIADEFLSCAEVCGQKAGFANRLLCWRGLARPAAVEAKEKTGSHDPSPVNNRSVLPLPFLQSEKPFRPFIQILCAFTL